MDRQLLLSCLILAMFAGACSRSKSPPPSAAAKSNKETAAAPKPESGSPQYRSTTTYEFKDDVVTGELLRPGAPTLAGSPPAFQPPGTAPIARDAPDVEAADQAIARIRIPADEQRRQSAFDEQRQKALAEIKERMSGVMGAMGSGGVDGSQQLGSGLGFGPQGTNPLRAELGSVEPPTAGLGNPLREPRFAPCAAAPEPTFAPAAADPGPSGGAAPPPGGLAEIERAFAEAAPRGGAVPSIAPKAAGPSAPETSAAEASVSPFDVVEVFYGTDRLAMDAPVANVPNVLRCYLPTVTVGLLAACLMAAGIARKSWWMAGIAVCGFVVSIGLGYEGTTDALAIVRGAGKQGPRYTTARAAGGKVQLGRCEITVPKVHQVGELEAPSVLRLEVAEEAARHLILHRTVPLADEKFYTVLKERVEQSAAKELFIFVHGFNVSFEDAARRTAQIHYDLKFAGAPVFFSWPAHDKFILTYPADETNVAWSAPHFKQFLLSIVKESGAKSINLIAHSMGNRALTVALKEIELELHDRARLFNQVILAAPDIDADDFRNNVAPAMQRTAKQLTLYASAHDEALMASQFIHRSPRAGDAGDGLIVVPGIDTIDVTAIDSSLWGHSYYGSSNPVLRDLRLLLSRAVPPRERRWLSPAERDGLTYWIFQPARTAALEAELTR